MNLRKLLIQYKDLIAYGFFGALTTLVNIVAYWLCAHPLSMGTLPANVLAWVAAVLFAYVTNRKWVFHSQATGTREILRELVSFFACRLATGIMDWVIMFVCVDVLHFNDMVIKVLSNILVIILNFVFSKLLVFRKRK